MIRYFFLLFFMLVSVPDLQAQNNDYFTEAIALYKAGKYELACKKFEAALTAEQLKPQPDISTRAAIYNYLGICNYQLAKYDSAIILYNKSVVDYKKVNDFPSVANVLKNIGKVYRYAGYDFIDRQNPLDSFALDNEVFFPVSKIIFQNGDSAIVEISGGDDIGAYNGAKGSLSLSYNSSREKTASNIFIADARVKSASFGKAVVYIDFFNKGVNKHETIYPGDLVKLKLYRPLTKTKNIFYNLSAYDILFLNAYRDTILTKQTILNDPGGKTEKDLVDYYLFDIHDFYASFMADLKDSVFNTIYKNGRFKGMTMKEAFRVTEAEDLYAFFNFVNSYPGKYMGKAWKLNETYATWIMNDMPRWEAGKQWLLPFIKQTEENKIDTFIRKLGWYLYRDSINTYVSGLKDVYNSGDFNGTISLANKLARAARIFKDKRAESNFILYKSYAMQGLNRMPDALTEAKIAYYLNTNSVDAAYNLGYLFGKSEQYDSCFRVLEPALKANPDRYDIAGNIGWYKILAKQWKEAVPFCKIAYEADSNSYAYAVNYGHTFLLNGNFDSARIYYNKTMEHLNYPNDYEDGPKKDFETFFTKGWKRKEVAAMLDSIDEQFSNKYWFITKGNMIWDTAKRLYDQRKYTEAAEKWKYYIDYFKEVKEPPVNYIHNTYTWIGYCYELMGQTDLSEKNYLTATDIAKHSLGPDKLAADYKRLLDFYNSINKYKKARDYKLLYDIETRKKEDALARPKLFLLAVEGEDENDTHGKNNARVFIDSVKNVVSGTFSSITALYIENNKLNRQSLLHSIDSIKKQSVPEDIFMFYYSGSMVNENNHNYFLLDTKHQTPENGKIEELEMAIAIKNIFARKKLILFDVPASGMMAELSREYNSDSYISNELIFLSPGTPLPQDDSSKYSLFTKQLLTSLGELSSKEKFTAKDLVTKATEKLGSGTYYLPVLSFQYSKDFVLYKSPQLRTVASTRSGLVGEDTDPKNAEKKPVAGPGKNYALLVACDIYDDPGLKSLANPVNDAKEIGSILKNYYGFDTTMIINASKTELIKKLKKFKTRSYDTEDQLFVFFAGHGMYDRELKTGYLLTKDSRKDDYDRLSYLSYRDLSKIYLSETCNKIFLVLDACFAGTFFQQDNGNGISALNELALKYHKGISSGAMEYVSDGENGHSPFANSFIQELTKYNDNKITADKIIANIKSDPPQKTQVCEGAFDFCDPNSLFKFELKLKQINTSDKDAGGGLLKPNGG